MKELLLFSGAILTTIVILPASGLHCSAYAMEPSTPRRTFTCQQLLSLRHAWPLPAQTRDVIRELGCAGRRRGCRAGRRVRARRRLTDVNKHWTQSADRSVHVIPTVSSRRRSPLPMSQLHCGSHGCRSSAERCIITIKTNARRDTPSPQQFAAPTYYLLNPTSIVKNDAFNQIKIDVAALTIDVLLLCETWLKKRHRDDMFTIDGFRLFRLDRQRRTGGGLGIYVRDVFHSCLYDFDSTRPARLPDNIELLWVHIRSPDSKVEHVIGLCYNPPKPIYHTSHLIDTIKKDLEFIAVHTPNAMIIFSGDLNQLNTAFLCYECGLIMINDDVTHGSKILDKFFVSVPCIYECSTIQSMVKTKHKAVVASPAGRMVNARSTDTDEFSIKRCYDTREPNINNLIRAFSAYNWKPLLDESDVQALYDDFVKVVTWHVDRYIPMKTVKVKSRMAKFITPLIKTLLLKRNRLMRRGKIQCANQLAEKIGRLISQRRSEFMQSENRQDIRSLWSTVNSYRNASTQSIADLGHPFDCVETINQHFVDIATDPDYSRDAVLSFVQGDHCESIQGFEEFHVFRLLSTLKRTSAGPELIPFWVYKQCAGQLTPIVTHIFNLSLSTGIPPNQWKHSIVTAIPKISHPEQLADLRPISVTPILSRCFERLFVKYHLYPAIPNSALTDQFAFRQTGSTTAALIHFFGNVTRLLEINSYVRCIYVDFSKAFDMVCHDIVLQKLVNMQSPQYVVNWLANFLTDRTQSVGHSTRLHITRSILQGSGIGPYLFLVMIDDLQPSHPDIVYSKYADDLSSVIPASISDQAYREIAHIQTWAEVNKLKINISKTKEMIISRSARQSKLIQPPLIPGLERIHSVKLLGVTFSENLSFSEHIDHVLSSVSQRYYLLKQLKISGLDHSCLDTVFHALVLGKITYAIQSFSGFLLEAQLNQLQSMLNKAKKWGLVSSNFNLREILEMRDSKLFRSITNNPCHCLHNQLPPHKHCTSNLRQRGHSYELPHCTYNWYKLSFINKCLFGYV